MNKELADRIERRLKDIPVGGGPYITFCQQYLSNTLSPQLIRKIAEEAADEASK